MRFSIRQLFMAQAAVAAFIGGAVFLVALFRPVERIEQLNSPIAVIDWTKDGLNLADGRQILPLRIASLPIHSAALSETTQRGVEIANDGRVYGLVKVHHWCGNDPVRHHIARIDLSLLLEFFGEGENPGVRAELDPTHPGGRFSSAGWHVGEFYRFQSWCNVSSELHHESMYSSPR